MSKIKIEIGREENATYYNVPIGTIIEEDYEKYVQAVVASEIGNAAVEVCKAQAVACRTYAYAAFSKNKPISDLSTKAQAFRTSRMNNPSYQNSMMGARSTQGEILYYNDKPITTCVFSSNNGGRTVSAKTRWGNERAWLIEKDDPWDYAVTKGKKTGHGVGMSQAGAKYAASLGKTYKEILKFYYTGTTIKNIGKEYLIKIPCSTKEEAELFKTILQILEKGEVT